MDNVGATLLSRNCASIFVSEINFAAAALATDQPSDLRSILLNLSLVTYFFTHNANDG